jgi:ribonucleoside-triphosphate reductase
MVYTANKIIQIRKRDDRIVEFSQDKIAKAIFNAMRAVSEPDMEKAETLSDQVLERLNRKFHERSIPAVEEIQDLVEEILIENKLIKVAKAYIIYRDQHAKMRDLKSMINSDDLMESYLKQLDWKVRENSNMDYSLQGLNNYVSSTVSANYWLNKVYSPDIRDAHVSGDFHIHDLQLLAPYCCGWDFKDILLRGFGGVRGKVESKAPKHFGTALSQLVNFFYTLQGEAAGAQAVSSLDTYIAPFVRYDNLNYEQVKQQVQMFLYNINVPTRVGFQCVSADTEILGEAGWVKHNQLKKGDKIATFNIKEGYIEYLAVKNVFAKQYSGKMFNLKNRISDQLISPEHRVVRRKFNAGEYVLEKIEDVLSYNSPFIVPVGSEGHVLGDDLMTDDVIRLMAWIISEGTFDKGERGSGRVSIYQSPNKSPDNYHEIISICRALDLKYTERTQTGLGDDCAVIRFDAASTRKILNYFKSDKAKGVKFVPDCILRAGVETAKLFLETYIKGDGHDGCKITTTSKKILDGLLQVAVNAGFGATVLVRQPDNSLSKKDRYIIRLIKHHDTYINKVKEVDYQGIIWCPNTDNETVIARRNGKIFITGNTPFTNVTMDLFVPPMLSNEPVIIGGEPQKETYGEFQKEMDMFNTAFIEVMVAGDKKGRVLSWPIPTYNVTKDWNWESPVIEKIMEMTAKYGIPYFSNFVNSDMKPEDVRSMCCRLRLNNRELRKRGGGLFGANPLTGSIGVVTINMARLGHLSKTKEEFFERLAALMDLAKASLKIKRNALEKFTEGGLYPYSRVYLSIVKERFNEYWKNHFNTIGLNGVNEACLNLLGPENSIASEEGHKFARQILDFMRERMMDYQNETNELFNLEATPAEGTAYRFARLDVEKYPEIIVANSEAVKNSGAAPYYTNSTQLPVGYTDDIFEALRLQDDLQTRYTGGTVLHGFVGERMPSTDSTRSLVKKIAENFHLPYFTITPTFSVCPVHGYLEGEFEYCPLCDEEMGYAEGISKLTAKPVSVEGVVL